MQVVSRIALLRTTSPVFRAIRCQASAAGAAPAAPTFAVLQYSYVKDILEKRGPYRADHLAAAQKKLEEGKLVMAGALADPVDGGLFIFKNMSKEEVDAFAKSDVYFKAGLISSYTVRPYMVAVGGN